MNSYPIRYTCHLLLSTLIAGNGHFLKIDNWYVPTCHSFVSVEVDITQCLLVMSNTILLASCTRKISLLSLIQAVKRVVEL
jgi:hypothetical protein